MLLKNIHALSPEQRKETEEQTREYSKDKRDNNKNKQTRYTLNSEGTTLHNLDQQWRTLAERST